MSETIHNGAGSDAAQAPTVSMLQALQKALADAFAQDPKVLALGEDVADPEGGGVIGITSGLSSKYGDLRVRSTPKKTVCVVYLPAR